MTTTKDYTAAKAAYEASLDEPTMSDSFLLLDQVEQSYWLSIAQAAIAAYKPVMSPELPKEPGWYWIQINAKEKHDVVEIRKTDSGTLIFELFGFSYEVASDDEEILWSTTKLPEPEIKKDR